MLSDLSNNILPFNTPSLVDPAPSIAHPEEDPFVPLNFDDLLDIARELESTRTITHIWPCDEGPSTFPETGLEDILAAIVPTPNAEESPLPLPSSPLLMPPGPVHLQEVDLYSSASTCLASDVNARICRDLTQLSKEDDWVQAEVVPPITLMLRGWSPPNGSQFLDLDDSHIFPQSSRDACIPPWLATFLASSRTQFAISTGQSLTIGDVRPQAAGTETKALPVSTTGKTTDGSIEMSVPFVPLLMQPSTRIVAESGRARSAPQTDLNVSTQTVMVPPGRTKISKPRPQLASTFVTGGVSTARYGKAPRGGIPPHIARTVTKANIFLVEKEHKVMRDAFPSTTVGEGKKPSVLRRAAKVERETGKIVDGDESRKKKFACENSEKGGRAAKRARV